MEDPVSVDNGPDLSFDERMRNHQKAIVEADKKVNETRESLGEVTPQVDAYASAYADRKALDVQGSWLIAAYQTLKDPSQRETLASNQQSAAQGQNGGPKPSEDSQQ